jgi:hypothetical protein
MPGRGAPRSQVTLRQPCLCTVAPGCRSGGRHGRGLSRLGVSAEAARRRATRAQWARQPGNDGRTRVLLPDEVAADLDNRRSDCRFASGKATPRGP